MYPLPPINVPAPVSSDFQLTEDDMQDMLSDEEAIELMATVYFPHIVWN